MDKLSISSVWQIKHTKNCNICKDCALEFSDLESYVSLHKIIRLSGKYNFESSRRKFQSTIFANITVLGVFYLPH
jgi:hypothetical protein